MLKHKVAITLKNGKVLEGYFSSDLTDPNEIIRNEILGLNNKQAFSYISIENRAENGFIVCKTEEIAALELYGRK